MEGNLRKGGRPKKEALPETKHVADLTRVVIFIYLSDDDEIQSKSWAAPSSTLEGYTMPCLGGLPSSVKHLRCLMCNREGGVPSPPREGMGAIPTSRSQGAIA